MTSRLATFNTALGCTHRMVAKHVKFMCLVLSACTQRGEVRGVECGTMGLLRRSIDW
jgi:hypothetical protein